MIWEPFLLAVVLGLIVSAGLYFAYLWPSVEPAPIDEAPTDAAAPAVAPPSPSSEAEPEQAAAT